MANLSMASSYVIYDHRHCNHKYGNACANKILSFYPFERYAFVDFSYRNVHFYHSNTSLCHGINLFFIFGVFSSCCWYYPFAYFSFNFCQRWKNITITCVCYFFIIYFLYCLLGTYISVYLFTICFLVFAFILMNLFGSCSVHTTNNVIMYESIFPIWMRCTNTTYNIYKQ